ncbi:MAG: LysR family transcriptional regulator [Myxococcota bacterium]
MTERWLAGLDLNLLTALAALLETNSVTQAARRVGLTQPAMSRALGRLRAVLGDPLFIRKGRRMEPTPRAIALRQPVEEMFALLEHRILRPPGFNPRTSDRSFRIIGVDLMDLGLVPALMGALAQKAPGVRLQVLRGIQPHELPPDLLLAPDAVSQEAAMVRVVADFCSTPLFRNPFVTVCRADHPALDMPWDLERYLALEHVLVSPMGGREGVVDRVLAAQGLSRRVTLWTHSFANLGLVLEATDLIATIPGAQAHFLTQQASLCQRSPPLPLPDSQIKMFWLPRFEVDPGHRWFRELVGGVVKSLHPQ